MVRPKLSKNILADRLKSESNLDFFSEVRNFWTPIYTSSAQRTIELQKDVVVPRIGSLTQVER